jgi:predicted dehydrogenase
MPADFEGSSPKVLRIGILGAARIAPAALIRPARLNPDVTVEAVASRDPASAARFAAKQAIPFVREDYDALINYSGIDAVYVPLPNALHAKWAIRALEAGKHVLCEKPLTSNADEAVHVAATAERTGRVLMEAFHYRYHPLAQRLRDIVDSGELGELLEVHTWVCFPMPRFSDIRYQYDLGGGALMDAGCYAVHLARLLGREEPKVVRARAKLHSADVDRAMRAELFYPGGHTGTAACSMWSASLLHIGARVVGSEGELRVLNPLSPQLYHRLSVKANGHSRVEHLSRRPTYEFQLEAFFAAVLTGAELLAPPSDSIANMRVIDEIYDAAGMRRRGT